MPNAKVLSEKQAIVASDREAAGRGRRYHRRLLRASPSRRTLLFAPSAARTKSIMPSSRIRRPSLLLSTTSVSMSSMSSSTAPRLSPSRERPRRSRCPRVIAADYAKKLNGKFEIGAVMDGSSVDMANYHVLRRVIPASSWPRCSARCRAHHQPCLRPQADR